MRSFDVFFVVSPNTVLNENILELVASSDANMLMRYNDADQYIVNFKDWHALKFHIISRQDHESTPGWIGKINVHKFMLSICLFWNAAEVVRDHIFQTIIPIASIGSLYWLSPSSEIWHGRNCNIWHCWSEVPHQYFDTWI